MSRPALTEFKYRGSTYRVHEKSAGDRIQRRIKGHWYVVHTPLPELVNKAEAAIKARKS